MKQLSRAVAFAAALVGAAEAQDVRPLGRTVTDSQGGLTIQWPSSGFAARFEGASVRARIEDYGDNWLNVEVDGKTTRIDLQPGVQDYELFTGAPGSHTIRVTRRTGPLMGPTRFVSITADKLTGTDGPARQILVIGDSITSGFGVEGKDRTCKYSYDTHNADLAYPNIVAHALDADLQSVSVDGHGLIRNWTGEGETMKTLAWQSLYNDATPWPTASAAPQVVVINLGTMDFTRGDPGEAFGTAYVDLLRKIRQAWPDAHVYGAIGSQLDGANYKAAKTSISEAVDTLRKAGDAKVHFIEFTPPRTGHRYGCDSHPGTDAHKFMAGRLQAAITADLGWKPAAK